VSKRLAKLANRELNLIDRRPCKGKPVSFGVYLGSCLEGIHDQDIPFLQKSFLRGSGWVFETSQIDSEQLD
jgi:hypothetical protein